MNEPVADSLLRGRRFALLACAILFCLSLPYLYLAARAPEGTLSLGSDPVNLGDLYSYVAWMRQAKEGHLLFIDLYDPAPQERVIFLPLFLLLGWIWRLSTLHPILILHLFRVLASIFLLLVLRRLVVREVRDATDRVPAFLLLALGTGLPWLVPEATPVSAMYDSGLHTLGFALLLQGISSWLAFCRRSGEVGATRAPVVTGLSGALLLLCHPYDAVTLLAVVGVTGTVVATKRLSPILRACPMVLLPMTAAAIPLGWALQKNPLIAAWAKAPELTSGWHLLALGTPAILAVVAIRPRRPKDPLILAWLVTGVVLLFLPVARQRRFFPGLYAPVAILAVTGFRRLQARGFRKTATLLMAAAFPMSILMLLVGMSTLLPGPRYLSRDLVEDIRRLERLPPGLIFTSPGLGYFVPPFSGRQVNAGQVILTSNIQTRRREYHRFLIGRLTGSDLRRQGFRYAFIGKRTHTTRLRRVELVEELRRARLFRLLPEQAKGGEILGSR